MARLPLTCLDRFVERRQIELLNKYPDRAYRMVIRDQIVQRCPMRIDLAAIRNPQSRRATAFRIGSLLFWQFLEQTFVGHGYLTDAANTSIESRSASHCKRRNQNIHTLRGARR